MFAPQKLTKKQRKGLAFRERTTGKRHLKNGLIEMENTAVPIMEDQDIASAHCDTLQVEKKQREVDKSARVSDKQGRVASTSKGTGGAEEKDVSASVEVVKTTKRKRAHEDGVEEDHTLEFQSRKVLKKKKDSDVKKTAVKQRFILFVGSHFSCCLQ